MGVPWRDMVRRRFDRLRTICGSRSCDDLDLKDTIVGMDSSLEAGLKAWLLESEHVVEQHKQRSSQKDCHFPEILKLVQKYCDLDEDTRTSVELFHEVRNKVQHYGYTPSPDMVRGYMPSISKLVQCLGVDVAIAQPQLPSRGALTELPSDQVGRKYVSLTEYLRGLPAEQSQIVLDFTRLEAILGKPMPPSAYRYSAWWANSRSHSHALAWLDIGWLTHRPDLRNGTVMFLRSRT